MDDSDNNSDTEPNARNKHKIKQHDEDNKHDATNEIAPGPPSPDNPQSLPAQESTTSPKSECSALSTNPGTPPSSNGSSFDRYYVQPEALSIHRGDPEVPKDVVEVPQGSTESQEMRECVNAAMCILSRTRTRDVMATYSIGVKDFMEAEHELSAAGNLELDGDGMQIAIGKWLDSLKREFPNLYITPSIGSCYGYTQRFIWEDNIDNYQPKRAADIAIHSGPFDRMCKLKERMAEYKMTYTQEWLSKLDSLEYDLERAQESKDPEAIGAADLVLKQHRGICHKMGKFSRNYKIHYERSLFHLAATLAHECFHVLTGYWTGSKKENTPPRFYGEFPDNDRGEAGEWWEYKHGFNGSVDLVWNKHGKNEDDPYPLDDENMSAGIPFLKQIRYSDYGSTEGAEWTRISHAFIRDFIEKGRFNTSILLLDFTY